MTMIRKTVLVVSVLLVLCAACAGTALGAVDGGTDKVLYVTGTGKITTEPDRAMVSLAVETEDSNVKTAQQANADRMNAVIAALTKAGLTSDDLKTTGYSIYPVREDTGSSILNAKVKYYRVTNTLQVTLKDVSRVGEIIDTAVANGADRTDYISFYVSDEKQEMLRSEVLADAVGTARSDADAVARALGMQITGIKEVSVGSYYPPVAYDRAAYAEMNGASGATTPIEPDTVDITATVSITYLIG
ncbi:MAG: SIMPL domain-containing protein [Methanomicrobiales archaeon]|nr:SIMPL domain-containing protein [Methanomicrobiales archaeon]